MVLLLAISGQSLIVHAGDGEEPLKADPRLLQMAEENPDATFMVIIQKDVKNNALKELGLENAEAQD